ncbi:MAG: alpha/beta hydrolase [Solobacterium sp.]|nr:alpha/beta hydrolase [Erysipelotrichaceae bacterium]MBQ1325801.1 alpha/beta hydrolase [Solobacterium sp.]MBQ1382420.1 alpha/beta hydrolase [Solobacterium sp.]MBQ2690121.1 alpha/beta hydrolase [Solobacterium sp.]MBQ6591467.1 alpha/beta hydrolase [Solobacterium sp.]
MLHEIKFSSFNERDTVYGWVYVPACEPEGIIQLIHGFGEHSRRYLHMITSFMEAGYIVAADDHVGHGKTALENDKWGDWGGKGYTVMVEDEKRLHDIVKDMFPDVPYFMFGHSMGSFITRMYMSRYGEDLDGAVICGTAGVWSGDPASIELVKKAAETDPEGSDPTLGGAMMGWMFSRIEEGVTLGNEWICHDPYVQKDHAADPFDAFTKPVSNRSWLYFQQMMEDITGPEWAKKVPTDLPIFNIAGDQDPVGSFGTGVYQVSNWLIDSGHNVKTHLYSGYRHEIHNYADLKDVVEMDIIDFLDSCL